MGTAIKPKDDRRSPDRHRVMLLLLRRVAAYSLALAVVLFSVPRILTTLGWLGPDAAERVATARQAVQVARTYGGSSEQAEMAAAEKELQAAEALLQQGRRLEARRAADKTLGLAARAQQAALVRRDSEQVRARLIVEDLDRRVDQLEDLYSELTPRISKERARELFSRMKRARATSAALVLAYEQQDWGTVVAGRDRVVAVLDETRAELEAAWPRQP